MNRRVLTLLVSLVSILTVFAVYFGFYGRESSDINVKTNAASGSATLTSQVEWEAGTLDNIDSTTAPNSIGIDNEAKQKINIAGATAIATSPGTTGCLFDESPFECWAVESFRNPTATVTIDLGSIKTGVSFV
jgi:hypothetical protein